MKIEGFADVSSLLHCGVYALCYKGRVVYIGQSKTMLNRLYTHRAQWSAMRRGKPWKHTAVKGILFDEVHIQPCHPDRVNALEQKLIDLYKPKYNTKDKHAKVNPHPIHININGVRLALNKPKPVEAIARRI